MDYIKRENTIAWFPVQWLKCTLPIFESPREENNFRGSSFLLKYNRVNYLVTARHVIQGLTDPLVGFHSDDKKFHSISTSDMNKELGLKWVFHPDGIDLAAIPFPIPDFWNLVVIDEACWNISPSFDTGDEILHLGYPHAEHSEYVDGSGGFFAISMPGTVLRKEESKIVTNSAGLHGASGGPLFLKPRAFIPPLIGIAVEATKLVTGEYAYKTNSLPISNVVGILETDEMRKLVVDFEARVAARRLEKNT